MQGIPGILIVVLQDVPVATICTVPTLAVPAVVKPARAHDKHKRKSE